MKHIFIINPTAGRSDSRARVYAMAEKLRTEHGLDVECMLTKSCGHAITLTRGIAESGAPVRFYACGGDGTANEVANGIAGFPHAAMTVIPVGTGNDLLKNFGPEMLPKFSDAENLWNGETQQLDLIDCNGRLCLTIACSGVDAQVAENVHDFNSSPMLGGRKSYLASVVANVILRPIGHHWTVTLDDEVIEDDFTIVSMCNGRYYGGGSVPIPEANMTDGVLNTILIKTVNKVKFATMFGTYSAGNYRELPSELVSVSTAKVVRIHSDDKDIVSCLDGECLHSHDVVLKLSDKKVNFFGPKGCNPNATVRN